MTFRDDIEILRAIAIALVLCYHCNGLLFASGFLGVDVFFVISGYLMAAIYGRSADVPVREFLQRRARRILPAYFATLCVTLLAAALVALPHELADAVDDGWFAALLAPNVGFWLDNTYFDREIFRPLLHFWSLGVEIQFYLLVPALMMLYARSRVALVLLAAASVVACLWMTGVSYKTSFFHLPFRLWQFLCGVLVAALVARAAARIPAGARHALGTAGLAALLALPLMAIRPEEHPGEVAVAMTLATAAVLACGLPRALAASWIGRGMVVLGRYSYALYLVHFPVLVLYAHEGFGGNRLHDFGAVELLVLLAVIAALTALLHHGVEVPWRRGPYSGRRRQTAVTLAALTLAALTVLVPLQRHGYRPELLAVFDAWRDRSTYRCGKLARIAQPFARSCALVRVAGAPTVLLVGDSHADAIKDVLAEAARRQGVNLRLMTANCALGGNGCAVPEVMAEIELRHVDLAILHAAPGAYRLDAIRALGEEAHARQVQVVVLDPVPTWAVHVPRRLFEHHIAPYAYPLPRQSLADYVTRHAALFSALDATAPTLQRVTVGASFCDPQCRLYADDGRPLYFDGGHLTLTGARRLLPVAEHLLQTALVPVRVRVVERH